MLDLAGERIVDLKSRGFDKAGVYDPVGVGGTHVMYVLHHADKPEIYAGLPANPRISPLVEMWKGMTKYAGMGLIAAAAVGAFFHRVVAGANRVSDEDEANAAKLAGKAEDRA